MEMFALEFFSGIGGLHCALNEAAQALKIPAKVLASFDVNPNANAIYATNFPDVQLLNKVSECASSKPDFVLCWVLLNTGSEANHRKVVDEKVPKC